MREILGLISDSESQTTEEIVGVLTAISIVSKRIARNISELEKLSKIEKGVKCHGKKYTVSRQGRAV